MLPAQVIKRMEALGGISKQGKRLNGLFRLMESPILWYEAYANIYSNEGAMTKGVDNTTLDGFSKSEWSRLLPDSGKEDTASNQPAESTSQRKMARNAPWAFPQETTN